MPIEPAGPQSYGGDIAAPTTTTGPSPSSATTVKDNALASDTIVSSEGTQAYVPAYIEPASRPQLPLPQDGKQQDLQSLLNTIKADASVPPSSETLYQTKLEQLVKQIAVKDPKLAEQVKFVLTHPDAKLEGGDFRKASDIAAKVEVQATEYVKQTTGDAKFEPAKPDTAAADQALGDKKGEIFEKVVTDNNKLTDKEKGTLLLAHYHPEALQKGDLTPKLQQLLQKYEAATEKMFDKLGIAPKNYEVPNEALRFDLKQSNTFSSLFQQAIASNANALTPPMNEHDINYLQFKLNNPDGPEPPLPEGRSAATMQNLFTGLVNQAKAEYTKETGFPPEFTPEMQKEVYNSALLGNFEAAFDKLLAKAAPPLTENQKTALRAALGQNPENIPKEIKALFEVIKGSAMAEVIKAFDLPLTWSPKTRDLTNPKIIQQRAENAATLMAVQAAQEMVAQYMATVNQMPEGSDKEAYGNYLKIVGAALNNLSMALFSASASDSNISRTMSLGNADTQMNKIKVQQDKAEEAKKKQEKAAKLQKVFGAFMGLVTAILSIFMGPLAFICTMTLTIQKTVTGTNFFEDLTKTIMSAIEKMTNSPILQAVFKAIASYYLVMMSMIINPLNIVQTITEQLGDTITNFLKAFGVPDDKAKMAGMIAAQATVILVEIAITILTAGAASEMLVGSFASMGQMIGKAVKTAMDIMKDMMVMATKFFKSMDTLLEGASKAANMMMKVLKSEMNNIRQLERAAEAASSAAKGAPSAKTIARAEHAMKELTDAVRVAQNTATKLATKLADEGGDLMDAAIKAQKFADRMSEKLVDLEKVAEKVTEAANSGVKSAQNLEKGLKYALYGFAAATGTMSIVTGVVNVNRELLLGQVERIKADMLADMIVMRAVIKAIKAVMDSIMSGMSVTTGMIKSVQKQQQDKYNHSGFNFVC